MKYLIIGGVAGGASTAARLRREDEEAQIIMFERGEYISYANCGLPYYIGNTIEDRENLLLQTPESFNARFNIEVRVNNEVTAINPEKKSITVKNLKSGESYDESYDKLLLSPGAEPLRPPLPGINSQGILTLRNIPDTDKIKSYIEEHRVRRAVVVGAGFIGLEMAENLHKLGIEVSIIEMANQVMAPLDYTMATLVHQHIHQHNVGLLLTEAVESFERDDTQITLKLKSGKRVETDLVILSIGVRPDTKLAREAGLKIGTANGIWVNQFMQTSDPYIYAVGDAIEFAHPITGHSYLNYLAGPANKQARIAANNIVNGNKESYKGAIATSIAKVFEMTVAATGVNAKTLDKLNIQYLESITHSGSHAGYYPGALQMSIKLTYDQSGKIFGAQIVGYDGVDKRIDTIASIIGMGGSIYDLIELEHAYAPPYSSAKDPVNMAGFVAENILSDKVRSIKWDELEEIRKNASTMLIDVRTTHEYELQHIEGAINIPVDNIRENIDKIPHDKEIILYCAIGLRGYVAARILTQNGFDRVRNLSGGFKTYSNAIADQNHTPIIKDSTPEYMGEEREKTVNKPTERKVISVDACGLQCPGPVMKLKKSFESIEVGQAVEITATDSAFFADAKAWTNMTGNKLIDLKREEGKVIAIIEKGAPRCDLQMQQSQLKDTTMVVFSNDLDKAIASFIIANGAASTGKKVTMFFTFWGLSILKQKPEHSIKKSTLEKMFGMMLPNSSKGLPLSQWNMGGIGAKMIRWVMKSKNVDTLESLIQQALENNVELIACRMSMDVMGIKEEELIPGVSFAGVAAYIERTESANMNLFI
ncbi:MAG: FAD-dependent oxidoreductase [Bacteroidales bacterium]